MALRPERKIGVDSSLEQGIYIDPAQVQQTLNEFVKDTSGIPQDQYDVWVKEMERAFEVDDLGTFKEAATKVLAYTAFYNAEDLQRLTPENMLASVKERLGRSVMVPDETVVQIMNSLIESLSIYIESTGLDESNEREKLANFFRALNLKDLKSLLQTIWKDPRLRKKLDLTREEKSALTKETFREGGVKQAQGYELKDIGELQKIFEPLLARIIQDTELRYYLGLAIDEASARRSDSLYKDLNEAREAQKPFYIPTIMIGFGVYGQVMNNELMHEAPAEAAEDVLTIDSNSWIGGQFARGNRPVFKVNNRVRRQKRGSRARPGTEDNIMPLGEHAVVDLPALSSQTYPAQNILGAALKTNGFVNSRKYLLNTQVIGWKPSGGELGQGRYQVSFFNKATKQVYEVLTDDIYVSTGLGTTNFGFDDKFDLETRQIAAESRKKREQGEAALYNTFEDYVAVASEENGANWRRKFQGEGVFIGDGDGSTVGIAGVLGYGPDDSGSTQANFCRRVTWLGQPAQNSDDFCDSARPRYVDLAREFPRKSVNSVAEEAAAKAGEVEVFNGQRILTPNLRFARIFLKEAAEIQSGERQRFDNAQSIFEFIDRNKLAGNTSQNFFGREDLRMNTTLVDIVNRVNGRISQFEDAEIDARLSVQRNIVQVKRNLTNLRGILDICLSVEPLSASLLNQFNTLVEELRIPSRDSQIFPENLSSPLNVNQFVANAAKIANRVGKLIPIIEGDLVRLEDSLKPVGSVPEVVADLEEGDDARQKFYRIFPVGLPEVKDNDGKVIRPANTLEDGRKVGRSVRMKKEVVEVDGKSVEKVRVFYINAKGEEESVLADWIVDATGFRSRPELFFSDFLGDAVDLPVDSPNPYAIIRSERGVMRFASSENQNPFLNGLSLTNVENFGGGETGKFYAKLEARTADAKEYAFEIVGERKDDGVLQVEIVTADQSLEAKRLAQALKIWFARPEVGRIESFRRPNGEASFKEGSRLGLKPVELPDSQALLPLASQVIVDGREEGIFFVGPLNKFPITDKERANVPALSDVSANLASMFRYVPVTEELARGVIAKRLKEGRDRRSGKNPYPVKRDKFDLPRARVRTQLGESRKAALGTLDSGDTEFQKSGELPKGLVENLQIPKVADPEVLVNYYLGNAFSDVVVRREKVTETDDSGKERFVELKLPDPKDANFVIGFKRLANGNLQWDVQYEGQSNLGGMVNNLLQERNFIAAVLEFLPKRTTDSSINIGFDLATKRLISIK